MRIFIGYDPREGDAYRVCVASLLRHTRTGFEVTPVNSRLLGDWYRRPESRRNGVLWDEISQAPMSTEFSLARFMVPALARRGACLYVDCDFMFRADLREVFAQFDPRFAVQVVKHGVEHGEGKKMDGQIQTTYPRKNWSSCILFNCDHPSTHALTCDVVNSARGLDLHTFAWLNEEEIGALPAEWNYLIGVSPELEEPKAVHFTLGTPNLPGYEHRYGRFGAEWSVYASGTIQAQGFNRAAAVG